jgi:hypothetical protein
MKIMISSFVFYSIIPFRLNLFATFELVLLKFLLYPKLCCFLYYSVAATFKTTHMRAVICKTIDIYNACMIISARVMRI